MSFFCKCKNVPSAQEPVYHNPQDVAEEPLGYNELGSRYDNAEPLSATTDPPAEKADTVLLRMSSRACSAYPQPSKKQKPKPPTRDDVLSQLTKLYGMLADIHIEISRLQTRISDHFEAEDTKNAVNDDSQG